MLQLVGLLLFLELLLRWCDWQSKSGRYKMAQVVYRDTHFNDNKYIDECFISISYLIDSSVAFENPIRFWLEIDVAAAK